jgi:hypothetical protein
MDCGPFSSQRDSLTLVGRDCDVRLCSSHLSRNRQRCQVATCSPRHALLLRSPTCHTLFGCTVVRLCDAQASYSCCARQPFSLPSGRGTAGWRSVCRAERTDGGVLNVRGVWPASNCQQRLLLYVPVVAVALPFLLLRGFVSYRLRYNRASRCYFGARDGGRDALSAANVCGGERCCSERPQRRNVVTQSREKASSIGTCHPRSIPHAIKHCADRLNTAQTRNWPRHEPHLDRRNHR